MCVCVFICVTTTTSADPRTNQPHNQLRLSASVDGLAGKSMSINVRIQTTHSTAEQRILALWPWRGAYDRGGGMHLDDWTLCAIAIVDSYTKLYTIIRHKRDLVIAAIECAQPHTHNDWSSQGDAVGFSEKQSGLAR